MCTIQTSYSVLYNMHQECVMKSFPCIFFVESDSRAAPVVFHASGAPTSSLHEFDDLTDCTEYKDIPITSTVDAK